MISWLVVDLGGVAADFRPERRLAALSEATGITPEEVEQRLLRSGMDDAAERGAFTTLSITGEILDHLDHRLDERQLIESWSVAFDPNRQLLDVVGCHALPVCLFTNNGPMLDLCLAGPLSSIASAVDEVVCSWHATAKKPYPAAFAHVAERLGAEPSELFLIDDDVRNVRAAIGLGWRAHRYSTLASLLGGLPST